MKNLQLLVSVYLLNTKINYKPQKYNGRLYYLVKGWSVHILRKEWYQAAFGVWSSHD